MVESRWRFVIVAGVLIMGVVGFPLIIIADWHWSGEGADNYWSTWENWEENHDPGDQAAIYLDVPESGYSTCVYDNTSWNDNYSDYGHVTITGESPTVFGFRIGSKPFHCTELTLDEYSKLDVDDDFTTGTVNVVGDTTVDVASAQTCTFDDLEAKGGAASFNAITASGTDIDADNLYIDADEDSAQRAIKFTGGGTITIVDKIRVHSEYDTGQTAYKGKLWVNNCVLTADRLEVVGGQASDRQAELDIDVDVTIATSAEIGNSTTAGGQVVVDVEDSKTFEVGDVITVYGPTTFKVTGSTTAAMGRLETSGS